MSRRRLWGTLNVIAAIGVLAVAFNNCAPLQPLKQGTESQSSSENSNVPDTDRDSEGDPQTPPASDTPPPTASSPAPTPRPTASATPTPTSTPTATPNATATPRPTATPTATPIPTPRPTATPTSTPKPTATPNPTPNPVGGNELVLQNKELFIRNDEAVFALNQGGGISSRFNVPTGFATQLNYKRVGFLIRATGTDAIINGACIEGWSIAGAVGGVRTFWRNLELAGRLEMPGTYENDGTWTGEANGLRVVQEVRVVGASIELTVTIKNVGSKPVIGMRYGRTVDPDDIGQFKTNNKIVARNVVEAGLLTASKGRRLIMSAADPKAVATAFGFINEDPFSPALFDSAQAVGFTGSEDVSLNMTWVIGDLGVGDSKTIRMTYEVK